MKPCNFETIKISATSKAKIKLLAAQEKKKTFNYKMVEKIIEYYEKNKKEP